MPSDFEQSFSDIAYSLLQEKALGLIPYLLGFEVVEKNDQNTRAIGIFVFQIGERLLYAPVFFLNGEVKPLSLLYMKENDSFIPLSEAWVDYLLKTKPMQLGSSLPLDEEKRKVFSSPNLEAFVSPPAMYRYAELKKPKALDFLSKVENSVKRAFVNSLKDIKVLNTVRRFYDWEQVKKACEMHPEKKAEDTVSGVKIVRDTDSPDVIRSLEPQDKQILMKERVVVKDTRPDKETSKTYDIQYPEKYQNPTKSGIHYVIDIEGNLVKSLVIVAPKTLHTIYADPSAVVVDLDTMEFTVAPVKEVFAREILETNDFSGVWSKCKELSKGEIKNAYLIMDEKLHASMPFVVTQINKSSDGILSYRGGLSTGKKESLGYCGGPSSVGFSSGDNRMPPRLSSETEAESWGGNGTLILLSPKPEGNLSLLNDALVVPKNFKLLPLEESDEASRFRLGTSGALAYNLYLHNVNRLLVQSDGSEYVVGVNDKITQPVNKIAALKYLTLGLGVRGNEAVNLLKEAERKGKLRRLIKLGQSVTLPRPEVGMQGGIPSQYAMEQLIPVPASYPAPPRMEEGNYYTGPSGDYPLDMSFPMSTAPMGNDVVFDHAVVGTLARASNVMDLITTYIPELQNGLDKLGRTLFLFWWKNDEFRDLFGVDEIMALEDLLRTVFKEFGDLILRLKRKSGVQTLPV